MSKIDISFRETLLRSDLPSVIQNFGEIGYDSLLDDGIFKSIPVLGTIVAIGKTFGNVRDFLFAKKMIAFLRSLSSLSEKKRQNLIHRLDADEKFGKHAGEQIIELLSRIDSERKAVLAAAALKLYAREEINSLQLQRVNYAIDRFILCDIDALHSFCKNTEEKPSEKDPAKVNFINAGLAYVLSGLGTAGTVQPNETAHLFLRVIEEGLQ